MTAKEKSTLQVSTGSGPWKTSVSIFTKGSAWESLVEMAQVNLRSCEHLLVSMNRTEGNLETFGNTVSMLTLGAGLVNYLSGKDNMLLTAQLLGLSKKAAKAKLEEMIDFAELENFIDEPVYSYSTGMRARLGFAVAVQCDPDILLIDEVLGVGDRSFQRKSSEKMKEIIHSGKTVVLISHHSETIKQLSDRALLIDSGKTVSEGQVDEVVEVYNSRTRN